MSREDPKKLVVYGTVLEEGENHHRFFARKEVPDKEDQRLPPPVSSRCKIEGADLFCFELDPVGYFPALVLSSSEYQGEKPHSVRASLIDLEQYDFGQQRDLLWRLDQFEEPVGFERKVIDVTLEDGSTEKAWAYVMTPDQVKGHKRILVGDWLTYDNDRMVLDDIRPEVESTLGSEVAARIARQIHEPRYRPPTNFELTAHVLGYDGQTLATHLKTTVEQASSPETANVWVQGDRARLHLEGYHFSLLHRRGRVPGFSEVDQAEDFQPDRFYAVRPAI